MALKIYNSLSQKKEDFVPLEAGKVKMYLCGPTVYGFLHVGNFRGPVFFNLVRNWLEKSGFEVNFVYNYTDVDDKIIQRAQEEKVDSSVISEKYITEFEKDFHTLGLRKHTHNPKVTDNMSPILDMIEGLVKNEKAYVKDGEVLYSVRSFEGYGKLSHKNVDDLQSGARVGVDGRKQDPLDFALWKPAKPGEPKWPSPWGEGRPGWHIECSAMIKKILGESIDIHGGGMDLIFPHHENEIAQSEGLTAKPFVKYWMHNNMLTFGEKKMSKSLGNIKTAREFLKEYNAEILKYMLLSVHYRSLSDFSEKAIDNAIAGLARVYSAMSLAESFVAQAAGPNSSQSPAVVAAPGKLTDTIQQVCGKESDNLRAALDDDFNTAEAFAALFTVIRTYNGLVKFGQKDTPDVLASSMHFLGWVKDFGSLMALFQEPASAYLRLLDDMLLLKKDLKRADIDAVVAERTAARAAKDFAKSDELRDKLLGMGIALQDSPLGTHWEVQK